MPTAPLNSVKQHWSPRGSLPVMVFVMQSNQSHCMPCSWDAEHQPHHRQFRFQLTHPYCCLVFNGCTYTYGVLYGCCTEPFKDVHIIKQPRRLPNSGSGEKPGLGAGFGELCFGRSSAMRWPSEGLDTECWDSPGCLPRSCWWEHSMWHHTAPPALKFFLQGRQDKPCMPCLCWSILKALGH